MRNGSAQRVAVDWRHCVAMHEARGRRRAGVVVRGRGVEVLMAALLILRDVYKLDRTSAKLDPVW